MKVGVTGGRGFIGQHVVDTLLKRGHEAVVLDHHQKAFVPNGHMDISDRANVLYGDVRDPIVMTELAAHVDGIIHLAAVLGTQETIHNPRPAAESNVIGGLNFLEAVAQYDLPGVYICVGNFWMENTYSISKTTVERFVKMFNKERSTRVNNVRVVNAYGPGQSAAPPYGAAKVRKITPAFVCRALSGDPIEIYGDGEQISDMVWVGDVALGLVKSLEEAEKGNVFDRTLEIGPPTSKSKTVNQVAKTVIEIAKEFGKSPVEELVHLPMRPGEIPGATVQADTSTLGMAGMDAAFLLGLEDGLRRTVEWFIKNEGVTWNKP